ncbi:hypothetical protein [Roseomonas chloroacetimidivorans]|uniref:hypothetical protein n=1 Tax=Roseomonas chloroacetimidivorans TaxID=1766656 RepID=UPI003C70D78B
MRAESGPLALARIQDSDRAGYVLADGSTLSRERVLRSSADKDLLPGTALTLPHLSALRSLWDKVERTTQNGATFVFAPDDLLELQQFIKAPFQNGTAVLAGLRGASAIYEEINLGALAFMDLHVVTAAGTVSFGVGQQEYWYALRSFSPVEWAHVQANGGRLVPMVQKREATSVPPMAILQEIAEAELAKHGAPAKRDALLALAATRTGLGTKQLRPLYQNLPPHLRLASRDPRRI